MSNLSDLIPAGGGQNNTDFVADGGITSGKPVILTAAGKAAPISGVIEAVTSPVTLSASVDPSSIASAYGNGKILTVYHDADSPYTAYGIVGTISGGAITYGTAVALADTMDYFASAGISYDSANDVFVICYCGGSGDYATGVVATVSGTSVSYGTPVVVASYSSREGNCGYDVNEGKTVLAWTHYSNENGYAAVGTVSGTSLSYGTEVVFPTPPDAMYRAKGIVYDANAQKLVLAWSETVGYIVVLSISGTTLSYGTPVQFSTGTASFETLAYDSVAQKCVLTWADSGAGGVARVVTVSGTTITLGTVVSYEASNAQYQGIAYDISADRTVISYTVGSTAEQYVSTGAVSGTDISFSTALNYVSGHNRPTDAVYDPVAERVNVNYGTSSTTLALVLTTGYSNLTASNLLGIASGAILDTATGTINTWGSRNQVQTGLTIASDYYAQDDGTITTSDGGQLLGKALSATQINIKDYTG